MYCLNKKKHKSHKLSLSLKTVGPFLYTLSNDHEPTNIQYLDALAVKKEISRIIVSCIRGSYMFWIKISYDFSNGCDSCQHTVEFVK